MVGPFAAKEEGGEDEMMAAELWRLWHVCPFRQKVAAAKSGQREPKETKLKSLPSHEKKVGKSSKELRRATKGPWPPPATDWTEWMSFAVLTLTLSSLGWGEEV